MSARPAEELIIVFLRRRVVEQGPNAVKGVEVRHGFDDELLHGRGRRNARDGSGAKIGIFHFQMVGLPPFAAHLRGGVDEGREVAFVHLSRQYHGVLSVGDRHRGPLYDVVSKRRLVLVFAVEGNGLRDDDDGEAPLFYPSLHHQFGMIGRQYIIGAAHQP